ncbi:MAG: peptide deformylase [Rhodospirillales bacterium]
MTVLPIARMGHPVLDNPAQLVADPTAPEITRLLEDMVETMEDAGGVGLAAPQVFQTLRIVVFFVPESRGGLAVPLTRLINPVIEPLSDEQETAAEACLSVPGLMGLVPRFTSIRYSGLDGDGNRIEREAHGFHARVVQHECDHLDGMLYPRRVANLRDFGFASELQSRLALQKRATQAQTAASQSEGETS